MRPIRAAWISDVVGSLGRSPEEEIAEELPVFQGILGYQVDVVVQGRGMHVVKDTAIDLLVFDYGGAAHGYGDAIWYQFEAMITWAQEHEGKMVLLFTSFTAKMYENLVKSEVGDRYRSENIFFWQSPGGFGPDWLEQDVAQQAKVSAWFAGGDFEPYVDEMYRTPARLKTPGRSPPQRGTMLERVLARERELELQQKSEEEGEPDDEQTILQ